MENTVSCLILYLDRNNLYPCDISPLCDIVIMYFLAPANRCLAIKVTGKEKKNLIRQSDRTEAHQPMDQCAACTNLT
jgi:hypothetical protein